MSKYPLPRGAFAMLLIPALVAGCADKERDALNACVAVDKPECYRDFLAKYPDSKYSTEAQDKLSYLDNTAWQIASSRGTESAYEAYVAAWPRGVHVEEAFWQITLSHGDRASFLHFLSAWPSGKFADDANWKLAEMDGSVSAYKKYINQYPSGKYADQAKDKILRAIVDNALSDFGRYVVNRCFGGGQNIYYDTGGIEATGNGTLSAKATIYWSGAYFSENKYNVSGDFTVHGDGSKSMTIRSGRTWNGTNCPNPVTMN